MIRSAIRNLSSGVSRRAAAPSARNKKVSPLLAAVQHIPEGTNETKKAKLKEKEARMRKQIIRDVNNLKQYQLKTAPFQVDPVLGDPNTSFIQRMQQYITDPLNMASGFKKEELEKLFYGAQVAAIENGSGGSNFFPEQVKKREEKKRQAVLTILNMRNTNSQDKKKMLMEFARKEFQRFEGDTGSPEVQAAVATAKIHHLFKHIRQNKKDYPNIETVRNLVSQRQRILKYLKRDDPEQYFLTIARLGLTDDVITKEFSMGYQYFEDYKVWGEKKLVKQSEKQKKKQQKFLDLERRVADYNKLAREVLESQNQ